MTSELRPGTVKLEWGHQVFNPFGEPIRLAASAVYQLRRLGMLDKNRDLGGFQISPRIFEMMSSEYDPLTEGLRPILGHDISGPRTVDCKCRACRGKWEQALRELEMMRDFKSDMQIQQNAL